MRLVAIASKLPLRMRRPTGFDRELFRLLSCGFARALCAVRRAEAEAEAEARAVLALGQLLRFTFKRSSSCCCCCRFLASPGFVAVVAAASIAAAAAAASPAQSVQFSHRQGFSCQLTVGDVDGTRASRPADEGWPSGREGGAAGRPSAPILGQLALLAPKLAAQCRARAQPPGLLHSASCKTAQGRPAARCSRRHEPALT